MRNFLIFLVAASCSAKAVTAISSSTAPEQIESSVWKVENPEIGAGSGFFIEDKNLFITNFHNLLILGNIEDLVLTQEDTNSILKIKRVHALSAIDDLALFEVETGEVETGEAEAGAGHSLKISEKPPVSKASLLILGYLDGSFKRMEKTGNILYKSALSFGFPVNHSLSIDGMSGSPILDENNQVVGILHSAFKNIIFASKAENIKKFISGKRGLNCLESLRNAKSCIKAEIENLTRTAKEGRPEAQFYTALMYEHPAAGQDFKKAFFWYTQAAEQGFALAQDRLANMYIRGKGGKKDLKKALFWYTQAAEQGLAPSQHNLSDMYFKGAGIKQDFEKAFFWAEQAAKQGLSEAQNNLGSLYFEGIGAAQNTKEAIFWLEKAAEQGNVFSQSGLGALYYFGDEERGVFKNPNRGIYWLKKAAEQGDLMSKVILIKETGKSY